MHATLELEMGKKKAERRHTAMLRIDSETYERVTLAASLMRMSIADYASGILGRAADVDIKREAAKLAGPKGKP
jgi:hypothetical protein